MKNITVIAPHLDDEVFSCGGTLIQEIRDGSDVSVVYLTDSSNSHLIDLGISKDPTPEEVAKQRRFEVLKATSLLGVKPGNLTFLDYLDGNLETFSVLAIRDLVNKLVNADIDELYFPAKDGHPDHVAANNIMHEVLSIICVPPVVREYVNWIANYSTENLDEEAEGRVSSNGDKKIVKRYIGDVLSVKNKAIDEYKSQISLFWESQTKPVLNDDFLRPFRESEEEGFISIKGV